MENANIKYSEVPLIKKIEKCNDNILYYGEGGIGKTTQMQLAFNYFSSKCTNTVPIFLDADKEIDFRKADPLMSAIAGKYLGSDIETDDIWKLFTNNSPSSAKNYTYIIFVDGINELTQNNKGYLIEKITHIISESKNTRFIISSRIKENLGLRFKNIAIKPLEKKNILKYLGENYGANDNSKNINDSLVEILQIPLYLSVFKNTYKGSDYKPNIYDESTVRKADILDSYIQKILHEKRKTNAADTTLFEFIVKYFLPALAFEMVKENMFSIDYDLADRFCESTKYFKGIAKRRFVDFNINSADTICVSNCALLEAHNDVYTFPHQIWRDYFCAKHIINCLNVAYSDQIQNDLEVPVDNEIRGFVGQLIYTYDEKLHYSKEEHFPPEKSCRMCECDFEAKDNLEDWDESPIEHYMQQHYDALNKTPIIIGNLISIMRSARKDKIVANYSNLNLFNAILGGAYCPNSNFKNANICDLSFFSISPEISESLCDISNSGDIIALHTKKQIYIFRKRKLAFVLENTTQNDNEIKSLDFIGENHLLVTFEHSAAIYCLDWEESSFYYVYTFYWDTNQFDTIKNNSEFDETETFKQILNNADLYTAAMLPTLTISKINELSENDKNIILSVIEKCSEKNYDINDMIKLMPIFEKVNQELFEDYYDDIDVLMIPPERIQAKNIKTHVFEYSDYYKIVLIFNNTIIVQDFSIDKDELIKKGQARIHKVENILFKTYFNDHYLSNYKISINYKNKGILFIEASMIYDGAKENDHDFEFSCLWFDIETETLYNRKLSFLFDENFANTMRNYTCITEIGKDLPYLKLTILNGTYCYGPSVYTDYLVYYYDFIEGKFIENDYIYETEYYVHYESISKNFFSKNKTIHYNHNNHTVIINSNKKSQILLPSRKNKQINLYNDIFCCAKCDDIFVRLYNVIYKFHNNKLCEIKQLSNTVRYGEHIETYGNITYDDYFYFSKAQLETINNYSSDINSGCKKELISFKFPIFRLNSDYFFVKKDLSLMKINPINQLESAKCDIAILEKENDTDTFVFYSFEKEYIVAECKIKDLFNEYYYNLFKKNQLALKCQYINNIIYISISRKSSEKTVLYIAELNNNKLFFTPPKKGETWTVLLDKPRSYTYKNMVIYFSNSYCNCIIADSNRKYTIKEIGITENINVFNNYLVTKLNKTISIWNLDLLESDKEFTPIINIPDSLYNPHTVIYNSKFNQSSMNSIHNSIQKALIKSQIDIEE